MPAPWSTPSRCCWRSDPNALVDELDKTAPMPEIPASLPVGLPSDLLRRRPDVREAERKMAAGHRQ